MATVRQTSNGRKPDAGEEIVEKGEIAFFYRPRVETDEAGGLGDVQRFFMVLKPEGAGQSRLAVLGRKRLPDVGSHERIGVSSTRSRILRARSKANSRNSITRRGLAARARSRPPARRGKASTSSLTSGAACT